MYNTLKKKCLKAAGIQEMLMFCGVWLKVFPKRLPVLIGSKY